MKYMILNPLTGGYITTENESEIESIVQTTAMELYLNHTRNQPVKTITDNPDGTVSIDVYSDYTYVPPFKGSITTEIDENGLIINQTIIPSITN